MKSIVCIKSFILLQSIKSNIIMVAQCSPLTLCRYSAADSSVFIILLFLYTAKDNSDFLGSLI